MLTILQSIILGALQGITEFLPVSSSGHLVVIQQLFGWQAGGEIILAFDVALHVGTLLAVLAVFWRDVFEMLTGRAWRLMFYIIVATIPAAVIGLSFKSVIETMFSSVLVVGIAWLVTGTFLWSTKYLSAPVIASEAKQSSECAGLLRSARSDNEYGNSWLKSLLIGFAQAFAMIPGISRSGSTIIAGLFLKLDKATAAKFAFLIAIPAIGGGALLDAKDLANFPAEGLPQLIIGTIVSFIVGYLSIKWLLKIIQNGKLWWFGIYCWVAGVVTLGLQLF